jgi:hypothetical protein
MSDLRDTLDVDDSEAQVQPYYTLAARDDVQNASVGPFGPRKGKHIPKDMALVGI